MKTKLVPIGDARGIAIDAKLLKQLRFTDETELEITVEDECLVVARPGARERARRHRRPEPPRFIAPGPGSPPRRQPRLGFPRKQPW